MIDLWTPEVFPFTVAILVMFSIAVLEGVGVLFGTALSSLVDALLPDINVDVDVSATPQGTLTKLLGWMNFGKVPILIIIVCFLTAFGVAGYSVQTLSYGIVGIYIPSLPAILLALMIALPMTRIFTSFMQKIMPKDETSAIESENFIGKIAVITIGEAAKGSPAEGKLTDKYGQTHYVMVEPEEENIFKQGDSVILSRRSKQGFYAIKNENSKLTD